MSDKPITLSRLWDNVEQQLRAQGEQDPALLHNMKIMYFRGLKDMLDLNMHIADHHSLAAGAQFLANSTKELMAFFEPSNLIRLRDEAQKAHDKMVGEEIARMIEEGLQSMGSSSLPPKDQIH